MPNSKSRTNVRADCHYSNHDPGELVRVTINVSYLRRRPPDYCARVYPEAVEKSGSFPVGYETVLGYFERTNPEAFSLLFDPEEDLLEDEKWIEKRCIADGVLILKKGDMKAFPVEMLSRRLG